MDEKVAKAVENDWSCALENAGILLASSKLDKRLGNLKHIADQLTELCDDHRVMAKALRDYQTIRARLVELEAENEGLQESTHHANGVADLAMKHRDNAEGRAEKADALLRECYEHGYDMKIHDRITAHLSENGHDHS